ncbi:hypothetical protein QOZ95_001161 [Paenibacillus brasilensis]|uniref:Uncharacterized protein n=2 Tax=Paenibacillus brasilensis TaxID=128574 RepID=A0ABU0KUE7_9BACL|nr:hypothetical protein [Paenibacillus brasilensis]
MKLSENYPKYKDATRKLKDYLDDQLAAFKSEVLSGNYIKPSKLTFKNFYENEWVPKYAAIELKNGATLESH